MTRLPFLSFLGEPQQSAYRSLCQDSPHLDFLTPSDWSKAIQDLTDGQIPLAAICGLLYKKLRGQGVPLRPVASPLMSHSRYQSGPTYWADIIVRADSKIQCFQHLQKKVWLFNEPGSYSGYYSYLSELKRRELGRDFLGENVETGSHAMSLQRLGRGEGDFTVVDSTIWDFLSADERAPFRVVASLGPKPAPLLVSMPGFGEHLESFFNSTHLPESFEKFVPVQDSDYDVLEDDWNAGLEVLGHSSAAQVFVRGPEGPARKPFTSLEQAKADQDLLELAKEELFTLLDAEPTRIMDNGVKFFLREEGGLGRHTYLVNPQKLDQKNMAIVGFFSGMKPDGDLEALFTADERVIAQFHEFPGLLIYYPREYAPGRWGNFVVFESRKAQREWAANRAHLDAVETLAEDSYDNVRLHLGVWTNKDSPASWVATKYIHYTPEGIWRGVRCYEPN